MKKLILFAGVAILLTACSLKPGYQIAGTVSDTALNDKYVYLYSYPDLDAAPIDSALVSNGTFALKGTQDSPALTLLRFAEDVVERPGAAPGLNNPFSAIFTLENAKLNVVLDSASTVTGTPENDAYTAFQNELQGIYTEMNKLYADMNSQDTALLKGIEEKFGTLSDKLSQTAKSFIGANTNKLTAAHSMVQFQYNLSEADQIDIIAKADSTFKSVSGIDRLVEHLDVLKKVAIGQQFTDFEMADLKGEVKKLSDYVGKGNYVLVDFWASWCGPCRKEMPNLVNAYKKYKAKGFEIVGVSLDSDKAAWEKGVKDMSMTWPQLSDLKGWKNDGAALYGVMYIPQTYLMDKEGKIIAKNLHTEELNKKLEELLK